MKGKVAIALLSVVLVGACTRRPYLSDNHCQFADKYRQARQSALEADAEIRKGNLTAANVVLERSLTDFDYSDPNVIDDNHPIIADMAERGGELKLAVSIRRRMLGERMHMYESAGPLWARMLGQARCIRF